MHQSPVPAGPSLFQVNFRIFPRALHTWAGTFWKLQQVHKGTRLLGSWYKLLSGTTWYSLVTEASSVLKSLVLYIFFHRVIAVFDASPYTYNPLFHVL